jgi:hypothetical protein
MLLELLVQQFLSGNPTPPVPPSFGTPLCQNGIYRNNPNGQDVSFPNIGSLNTNNFILNIDFQLNGYGTAPGNPVIMGGTGFRWIGIYVSPTGALGFKYNNSNHVFSSATVLLNKWYSAKLAYDAGTVTLILDGVSVLTSVVGSLSTGGNLNFTTNDFSNGRAHNGCIRNFTIYNGALVNAFDNCNGIPTITHLGDVISNQTCANRYTITRTYRATDECGNSSSCAQTITVNDVTPPTITCPPNVTTACAGGSPSCKFCRGISFRQLWWNTNGDSCWRRVQFFSMSN